MFRVIRCIVLRNEILGRFLWLINGNSFFVKVFGGEIGTVFPFYCVESDGKTLEKLLVLKWDENISSQGIR